MLTAKQAEQAKATGAPVFLPRIGNVKIMAVSRSNGAAYVRPDDHETATWEGWYPLATLAPGLTLVQKSRAFLGQEAMRNRVVRVYYRNA